MSHVFYILSIVYYYKHSARIDAHLCHWRQQEIHVTLPTMSILPKNFISCSMYAFTDELRQAWQQIFNHFSDLLGDHYRLDQAPVGVRQRLHLNHFEAIGIEDYQCIVDVRNFAIDAGYPELK